MADTAMLKKVFFFEKNKERKNKRHEKEDKVFFRGRKKEKDERERGPEKTWKSHT